MKVIALGAGYATRLYPLTRDRAKPLLEVGGEPILSRILERVLELDDLSEIAIVSNHRFVHQFESWASDFASPVPLRVLDDGSQSEADRLGAVGDIAFALNELELGGEDWMVVAGDNLIECSFVPLQRAFREARRPMIVVRDAPHDLAAGRSRYNEVTLDGRGGVLRFREKPPDPQTGLAAIALYFLTAAEAPLVHRYLAEGREPDAPGYWLEWLVAQTPVVATRLAGGWFDIGNLESLEAAREHFDPAAEGA